MGGVRMAGRVVLFSLSIALAFAEDPASSPIASFIPPAVPPTVVIGFLGGYVKPGNRVHSTVQLAERLRHQYPASVSVQVFENHKREKAYQEILRFLDADHDGNLSENEKQSARIILYGHSWGASEAVALARQLEEIDVPILLTIQVDSVQKRGQNDGVIPANVEQAINFYQPHGLLHGQPAIRAEDPERTEIVGNFRFDYSGSSLRCESYPWFNRLLIKPHTQIECDPEVWDKVESAIRSKLSPAKTQTAKLPALTSQRTLR